MATACPTPGRARAREPGHPTSAPLSSHRPARHHLQQLQPYGPGLRRAQRPCLRHRGPVRQRARPQHFAPSILHASRFPGTTAPTRSSPSRWRPATPRAKSALSTSPGPPMPACSTTGTTTRHVQPRHLEGAPLCLREHTPARHRHGRHTPSPLRAPRASR
jgi:hypothetical protein